jgi:cyanophycin synthetase
MSKQRIQTSTYASGSKKWQILGHIQEHEGFLLGCHYPSLSLVIQGHKLSIEAKIKLLEKFLQSCHSLSPQLKVDQDQNSDWIQDLNWMLSVWQGLQQAKGIAVFEIGRVLPFTSSQALCLIPIVRRGHQVVAKLVNATLEWLQCYESASTVKEKSFADEALLRSIKALDSIAAKGSNVPRFVKAAYELGLPWMELTGQVIQYGVSSKGRWLDSSFTDETPQIAAKLARNKRFANEMLAMAGLPVATHIIISDVEQLAKAAESLGYPVVIKPLDLDGGIGVAAGLENKDEVQQAFEEAKKYSKNILLEKHVFGKDYRLTIFQGELIWAIERVPAGVQGNGRSNIAELIKQVNADPRRGSGIHSQLKSLVLSEEVKALLTKQGLSPQSIPKDGQFVRLCRIANVASGGQPVAVYDKVHPDNARLAVRAALALGLDLAGVDLLIDDISRSWRESGANVAICEVNGQPNLGQTTAAHLYPMILKRLVKNGGRIPTILLLGADQAEDLLEAFRVALQKRGLRVGISGPKGVRVDGELICKEPIGLFSAGRILALNRDADAIVMAITEDSVFKTGLPLARYDALVLVGEHWPGRLQASVQPMIKHQQLWLQTLLPACDGFVMVHHKTKVKVTGTEKVTAAQLFKVNLSERELVERTLELILGNYEGLSLP